jgi:hypothetical protein
VTKVAIIVEVDDEHADADHPMGITNEAYEKLTGVDGTRPSLSWLGEVQDVEQHVEA